MKKKDILLNIRIILLLFDGINGFEKIQLKIADCSIFSKINSSKDNREIWSMDNG
jgi:hypothetical protein